MAIAYDVHTTPGTATNQTPLTGEERPNGGLTKALERMKASWRRARYSTKAKCNAPSC